MYAFAPTIAVLVWALRCINNSSSQRVAFSHIIRTFALATCWVEHFSCNAEISQCAKWLNAKLLTCCQEGHNLLKFGGLHNEAVLLGRLLAMDILTHFRTIEELTKTLAREQTLLSEMFEKRKLLKFPRGLAIDLVGGNETRLKRLVDYGVLVETGNTVEIESDYLNFFEEVLNVNEEISVLSVQECINTLKEHIGYFLQEKCRFFITI